jgi:hypothetical protein
LRTGALIVLLAQPLYSCRISSKALNLSE